MRKSFHLAMKMVTRRTIFVGVVNALQPLQQWNPGKAIARQKKSDLQRVDITNEISLILNEPFTKLMELCPNVGASTSEAQWMQRELTEEWVKEFEVDLQAVYDKCVDNNKIFSPYLGEIFVGKLDGSYFILDGQHRYAAFEKFHLKYEGKVPFSVPYKLQEFAAASEMIECFGRINKQRSLSDDVKEGLFTDTRYVLINHLKSKYAKHISKSEKPQFPNIHVDTIVPEIMRRMGDEKDQQRIIEKFEDLNKGAGETLQSLFGGKDYQKAKNKQGLYIGVWRNSKLTNARRNSVAVGVRNQLFQQSFGLTSTVGECFCCKVQYRDCRPMLSRTHPLITTQPLIMTRPYIMTYPDITTFSYDLCMTFPQCKVTSNANEFIDLKLSPRPIKPFHAGHIKSKFDGGNCNVPPLLLLLHLLLPHYSLPLIPATITPLQCTTLPSSYPTVHVIILMLKKQFLKIPNRHYMSSICL